MSSAQRIWDLSLWILRSITAYWMLARGIWILVIHTPFAREIIALFTEIMWGWGYYRSLQNMPGGCSVWWLELCVGSWVLGLTLKFIFSPLRHLSFLCLSFPSSKFEIVAPPPCKVLWSNAEKQLTWKGLYFWYGVNKYCNTNHSVALNIIIYPP